MTLWAKRALSLGLPVGHLATAWCCVLAWGTYLFATMSRDLSFFDSPELSIVAIERGLSHPPGQVLHTLLGALVLAWSPAPPLLTLNALSAVCAALCVMPVVALAELARPAGITTPSLSPTLYPVLTLTLCHATLWDQATRVEVYSLATLMALWTLAKGASIDPTRAQGAFGLGIGAGLTASANPVFCAIVVLAISPTLVHKGARARFTAFACCGGMLGLLPYTYLFIAPQRNQAFVWGDTGNTRGLLHYVTAADFQRNLEVTYDLWLHQAYDLLARDLGRWLWPILLFGVLGAAATRSLSGPGLSSVLSALLGVAYVARNAVWVPDLPDYASYLAPGLHASAAMAVALAARLWNQHLRVASSLLVGVLCGTSLLAPPSVLVRSRREDQTARIMASETLRAMPPNALAILSSDHLTWPALYLQRVEGLRPDVVIFPSGLASSSWFFRSLYRRHPSLERFDVHGTGGAAGRLRRFVAAQTTRPVVVEEWIQLWALGGSGCMGPWFIVARAECNAQASSFTKARQTLERLADAARHGDPTALGAVAAVSFNLGEAALRLGEARVALGYLLSPLPAPERFGARELSEIPLERLPPLRDGPLRWARPHPLGDPARNAWVAARVVRAAGRADLGARWLSLAASMGLPEALAEESATPTRSDM